ncbi:MAG: hypothetical protein ABIR04_11240 [Cypionkella sp.]
MMCLLPRAARADYVFHAGQLVCEGNRALLRVGIGTSYDGRVQFPSLPEQIAAFQAMPIKSNTCTLADGREVRVKLGFEQRWPYGACGAATNSFLSLWVGGKKVLSRQLARPECFSQGHVDIIEIDGDRLTLCTSAESVVGLIGGNHVMAGCVDGSDRLRAAEPDPVEYPAAPAQQPVVGSVQITLNARPGLCEAFLGMDAAEVDRDSEALWAAQVRDAFFNPALFQLTDEAEFGAGLPAPLPDFAMPEAAKMLAFLLPPSRANVTDWEPFLTWSEADFDNDGLRDLVLRFAGRSGANDSDVFYVVHGKAIQRIKALMATPESAFPKWAYQLQRALDTASGASSYADAFGHPVDPDQSLRIYQLAFTANNETLVFAAAIHRRSRPTAVIYKPLANGKSEQVCVYQRVEENW